MVVVVVVVDAVAGGADDDDDGDDNDHIVILTKVKIHDQRKETTDPFGNRKCDDAHQSDGNGEDGSSSRDYDNDGWSQSGDGAEHDDADGEAPTTYYLLLLPRPSQWGAEVKHRSLGGVYPASESLLVVCWKLQDRWCLSLCSQTPPCSLAAVSSALASLRVSQFGLRARSPIFGRRCRTISRWRPAVAIQALR